MADENITKLTGWQNAGFTDQDYIDEFNLDPNQSVNKQMLDLVERENTQFYIKSGYKPQDAAKMAAKKKSEASMNIKRAMAK